MQAAGGDPDAAAAAAAARVCPQPGTRRQRRRRTWQVQRPRSPGSRVPSELPSGSPRWWPRATRTLRCRVSELSWKVVEQTLPQWSRQQEEEEERRSRHRRMRWRSRGAEQLQPLPGAFACNPAASGRRRPPPMTSRLLPPLHAPRPARAPAPAAEAARRSSRPHWPRPRERATPTCREPMGARLASPSAVAARAPLLFSEPARPFACNRKPNNLVVLWSRRPQSRARAKGERGREHRETMEGNQRSF